MGLLLRLLVFVGLAVDAYVHWTFAPDMAFVGRDGPISGEELFRGQAVVAALAGLLVLAWARRWTYAIAFLVAASAFGAVVTYYLFDLGAIGPIPDMYDPSWYREKTISATGEAVAAVAAAIGVLTGARGRGGDPTGGEPVEEQRA